MQVRELLWKAATHLTQSASSGKVEEKKQQHKNLIKALNLQGFDARLLILTFGGR